MYRKLLPDDHALMIMTTLTMLGRVEMPAFWIPTTKGEEPAPFVEFSRQIIVSEDDIGKRGINSYLDRHSSTQRRSKGKYSRWPARRSNRRRSAYRNSASTLWEGYVAETPSHHP